MKHADNPMRQLINYDERSFLLNGRRQFLISGEIHYSRAPRAEWPVILDAAVEAGLNTLATYVFWNWHETARDVYDFSGDRDVGEFLDLCAERNLNVLLRLGPYCCGEWNYGGYPPYLRDEPGIQIRTFSEPYLRRVEKYFHHLAAEVIPHLSTHGGAVTMVQVENEYDNVAARYGEDGQRYLQWINRLAENLGFDVPRMMCEAASSTKGAAADNTFPSVNGFSISRERIMEFRKAHPGFPVLWTELWPGWYDTWGYQRHFRDPRNIARFILQFVGLGGCGWNYYMGYAGTNFGRTSMYLQTTNYGFGALLDAWGRPDDPQPLLRQLHEVLREHEDLILGGTREEVGDKTIWRDGSKTLSVEWSDDSATLRDGSGAVLFDTKQTEDHGMHRLPAWDSIKSDFSWDHWTEPFPSQRRDLPVRSSSPLEQLAVTRDQSDYCWYATEVHRDQPGVADLHLPFCGDFLRVYVDGCLVGHTPLPLAECRGCTLPGIDPGTVLVQGVAMAPDGAVSKYGLRLQIPLKAGMQRLEILACSLGLIKGDWMVSGSMETERKGIWDRVLLDGSVLTDWQMFPALVGETENLPVFPSRVHWMPGSGNHALTWHRTTFSLPEYGLRSKSDFRLDALGLGKGMLFVNGHALGRHWLIEGHGFGNDEFWVDAERHGLILGPVSEPTQRYYKVPSSWLGASNELMIFDEDPIDLSQIRLEVRG